MITTLNWQGLVVGLATFLIIGLCHPIVIKAEYYFGTRLWWVFLIVGLGFGVAALCVANAYVSCVLGVAAFCFLWSIMELFQQRERVRKGWFPANPKRTAPTMRQDCPKNDNHHQDNREPDSEDAERIPQKAKEA